EAARAAQLRGGDRKLRPGRIVAPRVLVAADEPRRAEKRQRELVAYHLVFGDVCEEERDPSRGNERARRIRRDRDLAVAAFYLQPAFDDRELPFRKRAVSGLSEPDVHANALVVARVVEVDADPHERFAGAELEARLRVHGFVVPDVTAVEHGNAPERPVLERLEMLLDRFFNQHVPL